MRVLIALLLAGCTAAPTYSPRYWVDYRAAMIENTNRTAMQGPHKDAPFAVLNAYAECSADYVISFMSPEDKRRMDEYAQTQRSMTAAETSAFEDRLLAAGAKEITSDNFDELSGICPESVPAFKQYLS